MKTLEIWRHSIVFFRYKKTIQALKKCLIKMNRSNVFLNTIAANLKQCDRNLKKKCYLPCNIDPFQSVFRGTPPPNLWSFRYPNNSCLIVFLSNNFSKMWSFRSGIFLKFSQNFQTKFLNFFQNRKNYHFSIQIRSKSPFRSKFDKIFS